MFYCKDQRVKIWEIEDRETYAVVRLSTSRMDKRDDSYKNSNWSFVKFVKDAYAKLMSEVKVGDMLSVNCGISNEPYLKDNVKTYPKNPTIVVFNFSKYDPEKHNSEDMGQSSTPSAKKAVTKKPSSRMDEPPAVEDNDNMPF